MLLHGLVASPLYVALMLLLAYIVWVPFGATASLLAYAVSPTGVAVLGLLLVLVAGRLVARLMVFPGSVAAITVSMEREYCSRMRTGLKGSLRALEEGLLRVAALTRPGSASDRRELLQVLSSLRLPADPRAPPPSAPQPEADLLTLPSAQRQPPAAAFFPAASQAHPLAELHALCSALRAHRAAAAAGHAARAASAARRTRLRPWGPSITGEGWGPHSAALLHYAEAALALLQAAQLALSSTARALPPDTDLLGDSMPLEGPSPLPHPSLSAPARHALAAAPLPDLLLSPSPFCTPQGLQAAAAVTGSSSDISPMSLTLTLAAALAAVRRLRALSPWLEVVPHCAFGAALAAREVAEASLKDGCSVWLEESEGGSSETPGAGSSGAAVGEGERGLSTGLLIPPPMLAALTRATAARDLLGKAAATQDPAAFLLGAAASAAAAASPEGGGVSLSASHLAPIASALALSPVGLQKALLAVTLRHSSSSHHSHASASPFHPSHTAAAQQQQQQQPPPQPPSTLHPLLALPAHALTQAWRTLVKLHYRLHTAAAASSTPSPVAGFPFLRAEASARSGAVTLRIASGGAWQGGCWGLCVRGGRGGAAGACPAPLARALACCSRGSRAPQWDGRYVEALLYPAGSPGVAWCEAEGSFAPLRHAWVVEGGVGGGEEAAGALHSEAGGEGAHSPASGDGEEYCYTVPAAAATSGLCRRRGGSSASSSSSSTSTSAASTLAEESGRESLMADKSAALYGSPTASLSAEDSTSASSSSAAAAAAAATTTTPAAAASAAPLSSPSCLPHSLSTALHLAGSWLSSLGWCLRGTPPPPTCPPPFWSPSDAPAFRAAHTASPSGTLVIMCAPNAGMAETSLRHHDALRFYTSVLGADVLLWNYVGYGRPVGAAPSAVLLPELKESSPQFFDSSAASGSGSSSSLPAGQAAFACSSTLGSGISPSAIRSDALAVAAWARSFLRPTGTIIVHGESMGGAAACAIARAGGAADCVIIDRSFDDLSRTAGKVMGSWARPALLLATGWRCTGAEDVAVALGGGSVGGEGAGEEGGGGSGRLKLLVAANDTHDNVIASSTSLATALAFASAYGEDADGLGLQEGWGAAAKVKPATLLGRARQAAAAAAAALSACSAPIPPPGSYLPAPTPAPSPPPPALAVLHPLPAELALAAKALAARIHSMLLYLSHEVMWGAADSRERPSPTAAAAAAAATATGAALPSSLAALLSSDDASSATPTTFIHATPFEQARLKARLHALGFTGLQRESCAAAAAVGWVLGPETTALASAAQQSAILSDPSSLPSSPSAAAGASSSTTTAAASPSASLETLRPPLLPRHAVKELLAFSAWLAQRFEREEGARATAAALAHLPAHLPPHLRPLAAKVLAGGAASALTSVPLQAAAAAGLAAAEASVAAADAAASGGDAAALVGWVRGLARGGGAGLGPLDGERFGECSAEFLARGAAHPAGALLVALGGLSHGLGGRCGDAAAEDGVGGVRAWLAGGLMYGWGGELAHSGSSSSNSPGDSAGAAALTLSAQRLQARQASRDGLLARACTAPSPAAALQLIFAQAVEFRAAFTLAREVQYTTVRPPIALGGFGGGVAAAAAAAAAAASASASASTSAPTDCMWVQSTAGALPWSAVDVALARCSEARPGAASGEEWGSLAAGHLQRVWGEVHGLLEEVQLLRGRVAEALGRARTSSSSSGSASAAPALLVLPLSCGHNLPWQPAESALLACALREAFPALQGQ